MKIARINAAQVVCTYSLVYILWLNDMSHSAAFVATVNKGGCVSGCGGLGEYGPWWSRKMVRGLRVPPWCFAAQPDRSWRYGQYKLVNYSKWHTLFLYMNIFMLQVLFFIYCNDCSVIVMTFLSHSYQLCVNSYLKTNHQVQNIHILEILFTSLTY